MSVIIILDYLTGEVIIKDIEEDIDVDEYLETLEEKNVISKVSETYHMITKELKLKIN